MLKQDDLDPHILEPDQLAEAIRLGTHSRLTARETFGPSIIIFFVVSMLLGCAFLWFLISFGDRANGSGFVVGLLTALLGYLVTFIYVGMRLANQRALTLQTGYLKKLDYYKRKEERDRRIESLLADLETYREADEASWDEPTYFRDTTAEWKIEKTLDQLRELGYFPRRNASGASSGSYSNDQVPYWYVEGYDHSRHRGMFTRSDRQIMNDYGMDADTYINNVLEAD